MFNDDNYYSTFSLFFFLELFIGCTFVKESESLMIILVVGRTFDFHYFKVIKSY